MTGARASMYARPRPDTSPLQVTRPSDILDFERGPSWPNRIALAPLTNRQSNPDGTLHEDELRWLQRRAVGGFSMVMTCAAAVAPEGQAFPGQLALWDDKFIPGLARMASALRSKGSVSSVQLHHGGFRADPSLSGLNRVAPWADPDRQSSALTTAEVRSTVQRFADAARRVERAGFDGVELHGAHGYLLAQFLDGRNNTRTDRYGGDIAGRMRVLLESLAAIRDVTGPQFQVGLRLSPTRYGIDLDDALISAESAMASGLIDYLDMSMWDVRAAASNGSGLTELFAGIPRGSAKLGVAGKIHSAADAQWCLDQGADFVLVGTSAIAHHDFAHRVLRDSSFNSLPPPFSRSHLEAEAVGPRFIEYLATEWDDFVCEEAAGTEPGSS